MIVREHTVNGIAVTEHRPESTPTTTIVLLSSLGISRRSWDTVGPELGAAYRCLAVDLPGHGGSTPANRFMTIPDFASAVVDVIDELSPSEPVVLVGNSMGASIATEIAIARPDRCVALVQVAPAIFSDEPSRRDWLHARSEALCTSDGAVRHVDEAFVERVFGRYERDWHERLLTDQQASGARLGWALWALYAYDTFDRLASLTHDLLVVFGENDDLQHQSLPLLRQRVATFDEHIVPGGSHLLPVDQGPTLAETISNWLDRRGSASA